MEQYYRKNAKADSQMLRIEQLGAIIISGS